MPEPVILVDVMNTVFRCHYAHRNLTCEGESTGVWYGFLKVIHDLRESVSKRLVFCWDHGVPQPGAPRPKNWRDSVVKNYKAGRVHNDEEYKIIVAQLPKLFEALCMLGYSSVSTMGLEADDIIALLASDIHPDEILIFSTDRDFYQLLDNHTRILTPKKDKGGFRYIDYKLVEKELEIPVERIAEYLALGGDSSDNIKPMRGMGPKTAIKLIHDGIDLRRNKSFGEQPKPFRSKWGKLEPVWGEILKSYFAAKLPIHWSDPRIRDYVSSKPVYRPDQYWPNEPQDACREKFLKFVSTYEMNSLVSIYRKFFVTNIGEQPCQQTPEKPVTKPLPKNTPAKPSRLF
jgi:5'-3' exonuclease